MSTWQLLYTGGNLSRVTTRRDTEENSTERQARPEPSCQLEARIWHALDPPSQIVLSSAPYCSFGKITRVVPLIFHLGKFSICTYSYKVPYIPLALLLKYRKHPEKSPRIYFCNYSAFNQCFSICWHSTVFVDTASNPARL